MVLRFESVKCDNNINNGRSSEHYSAPGLVSLIRAPFISRGICGGHVRYLRAKLQEPVAATAAGSAAEVTSHVSSADNRGTNHRRCCCSSMDSYARDRTAAINQNGNLSEF